MKTTGGDICLDKSFMYAIDFEFDENGDWSYKILERADTNLEVKYYNEIIFHLVKKPI